MKLVAFKIKGVDQSVYINPSHVLAVEPDNVGGSRIVTVDKTYNVHEAQDDVAASLMGAGD